MPAEVSEKSLSRPGSHRPQLIEHYYAGDIFVLPSICNDSFGIPVVEQWPPAPGSRQPIRRTRSRQ